jgi:hypothetical protein
MHHVEISQYDMKRYKAAKPDITKSAKSKVINTILGIIGVGSFIGILAVTNYCEMGGSNGTYIIISAPLMALFGASIVIYNAFNGERK